MLPIVPDGSAGCRRLLLLGLFLLLASSFFSARAVADETVVVNAYGSPVGGVWPIMELWVNGGKIGSVSVGSATRADYSFSGNLPAGKLSIDVVFTNDAYVPPEDRNLYVKSLTVRGQTLLPTDPGVVYELPYSAYSTPSSFAAGTEVMSGAGALRFSTQPNIVGNCYSGITGYTTINAAITAAIAGDVITICPGTYSESVSLTKTLTLRTRTSTRDVTIDGGSAPALSVPYNTTAQLLILYGLTLKSTGSAVAAAYVNGINTKYSFQQMTISSTGTALDFGNSTPGQMVISGSSITSTNGMGIALGYNAVGALYLAASSVTSRATGVSYAGAYSSSANQHTFTTVQITTTGSGAAGIDLRSGRLWVRDTAINAAGVGIYHDAGHTGVNVFQDVTINSGDDGLKTMTNLTGAHTFDNLYIRPRNAGARGLAIYGGATFNNLNIQSDGDALYIGQSQGRTQTYTNLTLASANGYGIRLASSGTQNTTSMAFGSAAGPLKITAKQQGIFLGDSMSSSATLSFNNVDVTSERDGIYLSSNMGGQLTVGNLAAVSINTTSTASAAWGLYVSKASAVTVNNLTVNSSKGGVYLDSNVTGNVTLQGAVTKPLHITANGQDVAALHLGNAGGNAVIDQIVLRQPVGPGLLAGSNAKVSQISNFDIQTDSSPINILSPSVDLTLRDGKAIATRNGSGAIVLANSGSCAKKHKISNVVAAPGAGAAGIYVGCASKVEVAQVCTVGGNNGLFFASNAGEVKVSNSLMKDYSSSGLQLLSDTSGGSVKDNCFTTATNPMAFSPKYRSQEFDENYWQGVSGNKYQPNPSGNGVNDHDPRSSCHLANTLCTGAPAAPLVAQYRFEEMSTYNGTSGEVKDSSGTFNGQALGTPLPEKLNLSPARRGGSGTCNYLSLPGPSVSGGAVNLSGLPISTTAGAQTSVAFWMYWDGTTSVMPIGWQYYDLWLAYGGIGFNTSSSDLLGTSSSDLANGWHHVVAVFTNGDVSKNLLYIDGVAKTLTDQSGGRTPNNSRAVVQSTLRIGGWGGDGNYRFAGRIDELKVFNGAVNPAQVVDLYNETHLCPTSAPIADWRFDEVSWSGTPGEVRDSSPNGQHGTAPASYYNAALRANTAPGGKICGRADFSAQYTYVDVANSTVDQLQGPFTAMGWIRLNDTGSYQYIYSNSRDCCGAYRGFELLGRHGSAGPRFAVWFSDGTRGDIYAPTTLATGTWAHVAGVWDGSALRIYVNGVLKGTQSYAGKVMASPASYPGTIGAMGRNSGAIRGYYDANASVDEVKVWDRVLSDSVIAGIYANENGGINWDGTGRDCDLQSPVADWHMDETAWSGTAGEIKDTVNSASSGPHGKAVGGAQNIAGGLICRGGGFDMTSGDGAGDYALMPIPASGLSRKKLSTSLWVKFDALVDEAVLMYIPIAGTSGTSSRYFYLSTWQNVPGAAHNGLHFGVLSPGGSWGRGFSSDSDVFVTGQWYHIVTVVDVDKGRLSAYVNGVLKADLGVSTGDIPGTPSEIWLGGSPESTSKFLDGQLDEVMLFNGALTSAQASAIYSYQLSKKNWDGTARTCPVVLGGIPANFNCVEPGADAAAGRLYTKLAGKSFSFDVVALKADGTVQSAYASDADRAVTVELIDGSQSTACAARTRLSSLPAFTFATAAAATEKGRKTYTVADAAVPGAYANVRCRITDSGSTPGTPVTGCSTDNFAIRPAAVTLSTAASAPTSSPINANTPTLAAGADFSLNAASTTSNYTGSLRLDVTKLTAQSPVSPSKATGGVVGALAPATLPANSTTSLASYSEVGYVYLAPGAYRDDQFTAVDQPNDCISSTASTDYLSDTAVGGKYGCSVGNRLETTLGRFIPAYLNVTPSAATPRSDLSCSPASTFTYYGEDFSTAFLLTAHNSAGGITQNYSGLLARLNPALWSIHGLTTRAATGTTLAAGTFAAGAGAASGSFAAGSASVKLHHQYTPSTAPAAESSLVVTAKPVDADAVTLLGSGTDLGSFLLKQGRTRLLNAHGAEVLDLPVPFQVESYAGASSGWRINTDDNCTPVTVSLQDGSNLIGSAGYPATNTCVINGSSCATTSLHNLKNPPVGGAFNLWLKAPGAGKSGYVTATGSVPAYLQPNPSARATFGVRKSGPVVIRRDVGGQW